LSTPKSSYRSDEVTARTGQRVYAWRGDAVRYEFTFVVGGVDPDDNDAAATLAEHLDAMLARGAGVSLLVIEQEGFDAIDAARNAVLAARFRVPEMVFQRVDRDLVGISEIADRTGRSRQNVAQLVAGERHEAVGPFPQVEGVVGRARVWIWGEVNTWLRQIGLGDDVATPTREEMTDIDYMLRHDRLLPLDRPPAQLSYPLLRIDRAENALVMFSGSGAAVAWPGNAIQVLGLLASPGVAPTVSDARIFTEVAQ
jgi:hypothetical protein